MRFDLESTELKSLVADWLTVTRGAAPTLPLGEFEAERRASQLLQGILDGRVTPASVVLDEDTKQILSVLVRQLANSIEDQERKLHSADAVYQFIRRLMWPGDTFGECQDLLLECAEIGWRTLGTDFAEVVRRRFGLPPDSTLTGELMFCGADPNAINVAAGRVDANLLWPRIAEPFASPVHRMSREEGRKSAEEVLAIAVRERLEKAHDLGLDDPELLLGVCEVLCSRFESSPAEVRTDAEFFYQFVGTSPRRVGLFDEREYLLAELARIAGTACRVLFHRERAAQWFDRSESHFLMVSNRPAHLARIAYQRLALTTEERRFQEVLDQLPTLTETLDRLGLAEDALKCRFLRGIVLREAGDSASAVDVLKDVLRRADEQRKDRLVAVATGNLVEYCGDLGKFDEAMAYARKAFPLMKQLSNNIGLVKLRWSLGDILRKQIKFSEAIDAYREALESAREVGTRNDEVSIRLALAEVLIDAGHERAAEWEIRAALPIIEEEKMVPEGYAALSLLRDALRLRQVDRKALRQLHGYFRDSQS